MIDEYITKIFVPESDDDWFLIKTEKSIYSLRLGGIKREDEMDSFLYSELELPLLNKKIKKIYTDDFSLYFQTYDGDGLKHAQDSISSDGDLNFAVTYLEENLMCELINEMEDDDDFKIITE